MTTTRTLTTREVAKALGVSPRTVARWVKSGVLTPASVFPLGARASAYLFDAEQIEALAAERDAEAAR